MSGAPVAMSRRGGLLGHSFTRVALMTQCAAKRDGAAAVDRLKAPRVSDHGPRLLCAGRPLRSALVSGAPVAMSSREELLAQSFTRVELVTRSQFKRADEVIVGAAVMSAAVIRLTAPSCTVGDRGLLTERFGAGS